MAKRHSAKKSSTNFLVTHIKSVADLRNLLTDDNTYGEGDVSATAQNDADVDDDDDIVAVDGDEDGETIEIEEEVDDDADENDSESRSSSGNGKKKAAAAAASAVDRKVAKKSTTVAVVNKRSVTDGELRDYASEY